MLDFIFTRVLNWKRGRNLSDSLANAYLNEQVTQRYVASIFVTRPFEVDATNFTVKVGTGRNHRPGR